jgi:hypothetical protein
MQAISRIMNRNIIFLLLALTCGCTEINAKQKESFIQSMDKWIGRSADDLVATNGAPANVYPLNSGGRVFEYIRVLMLSESEADRLHRYASSHRKQHLYVPDTRRPSETRSSGLSKYVLGAGKSCKLLFEISAGNIVDGWNIDEGTCY